MSQVEDHPPQRLAGKLPYEEGGFEEEETADHQTHSGCGTPPPPISRERAD